MAYTGAFRRFLGGLSTVPSRSHFVRQCSTFTARRLEIVGLSSSITEDKLKNVFAPYGNLVDRYTESKHFCTQAEAQGGNYINNGKEVEKQSKQKGDIISCLNDLLFTSNRDYLVRNNNEHVKAEQLEGKVIVIYFLPLYVMSPLFHTSVLKDVYDGLKPLNNFEVVVVPIHVDGSSFPGEKKPVLPLTVDPQKHFEGLFAFMPWIAIPFSDAVSREHIERHFLGLLGREEYPFHALFIVDSKGMILQCPAYCPWYILLNFGASGYPFSDEKLDILRAEDDAAAKQPSLKMLLASPQRNYVISGNGDEVPIHTFEDKVVALYFYFVDAANEDLTRALKSAYEELAIKKKFEVVLVYLQASYCDGWRSDWEESFQKEFKTMPWLALPFRDESCKKLKRIFKISCEGNDDYTNKLVIIGPHAEFIEPYGVSILFHNIPAYPFTRKKVAELEIEKIRELKLEMLWYPNTFLRRNNGAWVPFSALSGKRVMLILEWLDVEHDFTEDSPHTKFSLMLKERYLHTRGTDDEFEVIRILIDNEEFSTKKNLGLSDMYDLVPLQRELGHRDWLVTLRSKLRCDIGSSYFWYGKFDYDLEFYLSVLAFDRDGRLVRKTMCPTFEDMEFPFYAGSLEEEMLSQLATFLNY